MSPQSPRSDPRPNTAPPHLDHFFHLAVEKCSNDRCCTSTAVGPHLLQVTSWIGCDVKPNAKHAVTSLTFTVDSRSRTSKHLPLPPATRSVPRSEIPASSISELASYTLTTIPSGRICVSLIIVIIDDDSFHTQHLPAWSFLIHLRLMAD